MKTVAFPNIPNNVEFAVSAQLLASDNTTPVDLTGSTLLMHVRETATGASLAFPVTVALSDAPNGRFTIAATVAALGRVPARTYLHDLIRIRPDGIREQVWAGTLTITQGITRP